MISLTNIESLSSKLGFIKFGIVPISELHEQRENYTRFLSNGYHGDMSYLSRNVEKRLNPALLVDGAKSIISLLAPYPNPSHHVNNTGNSVRIASYAHGLDYHKVVKDRLHIILNALKGYNPDLKGRVFVDSAPVLEREWAVRAGLGFIGKNGMLVNREYGLRTFIGSIICNISLPPTKTDVDIRRSYCGTCTKCIDACPANAFKSPYVMDASKCLSYQTIEADTCQNLGTIRSGEKWIFGCDICIEACPWSKKGDGYGWSEFAVFSDDFMKMAENDWLTLSNDDFEDKFGCSPLKRAGLERIKINIQQWNSAQK